MDYNKDSQKEMSKRVEASKTWTEKQIPLKGAPICGRGLWPLNTTFSQTSKYIYQQKSL